jgi:hypothetical protein
MLLSRDGRTIVVADPDRDFVSLVDLSASSPAVRAKVVLSAGDEPGRIAEDAGGLLHVALRGAGQLVTISLATGEVLDRRPVCAQPRGVAYDAKTEQVLVACATGELVTLPTSGPATQTLHIEPDLRDVVVDGDSVFVSKFRTAEILKLDRGGTVLARVTLPVLVGRSAAQAWRMRETQDHRLLVVYQSDSTSFIPTTPGGYGNSGSSPSGPSNPGGGPLLVARAGGGSVIVTAAATVSTTDLTTTQANPALERIVLPVDIAPGATPVGSSSDTGVIVGAGEWKSQFAVPFTRLVPVEVGTGQDPPLDGQLIAVEIGRDGTVYLQSREPARLFVVQPGVSPPGSVSLSEDSREDTGHTIFHTNSAGGLACASCHGEGGDDAQTWNFDGNKTRRTPSLLGTIKGTAPYHWDADFADMPALVHEVYTRRMGGRLLASDQVAALQHWVEALPAPRRPAVDTDASARGKVLFEGKAGCATCHSGGSYTNNATVDVGTGKPLQVPPLVGVGARAPFLHAGCASTLTERFTKCSTPGHGNTADLTSDEIGDLVTFLNAL